MIPNRETGAGPRILAAWFLVPVGVYCFAAALFVLWGGFVGDEGYYALVARFLTEGSKLYRDVFCPQLPVMFHAYAGWFSLFGPGILSGRVLSAVLGLGTVMFVSLACAKRGGNAAGFVGGMLVACSPHVVFDLCLIKTQSMSAFLSAVLLFVLAGGVGRPSIPRTAAVFAIATLMAFTRLSLLPCLILAWILMGWELRHQWKTFAVLVLVNLAIIAVVLAWFWADGNLLFDVYRVHKELWGPKSWSFAWLTVTIKSWIGNQLPIIFFFFCAIGLFASRLLARPRECLRAPDFGFLCLALAGYASYTFLHWQSVQSYATHQTVVAPFAVVFALTVLGPVVSSLAGRHSLLPALAFGVLLCLPMPFGEWGIFFNGDRSLGKIREAVELVRKYAGPKDSILTFNVEIPVQGGFRVPRECVIGEFTYFPAMPEGLQEKYRLLGLPRLIKELESGNHRILCMGNREFAVMACGNEEIARQLKELIDRKYIQVGTITNYGQFNQELFVYAAKY